MTTSRTGKVIQHLRSAALRHDDAARTDGELVRCFIERRDDAAFAVLVCRHAPMVWGVCRRLLDHHDAEDAFQAAFLILACKAAAIRPGEMAANWLYGVAGQAAVPGAISAKVAALTEGVIKAMVLNTLWNGTMAMLVLATLGLGAGVYLHGVTGACLPPAAEIPTRRAQRQEPPAPPHPGADKPVLDVDALDAIAALEAKHVQLERDAGGLVVHARLHSQGPVLGELMPHLKRLPRLSWVACHPNNLTADGLRQLSTLRSLVQFELHANEPFPAMPWQELGSVRTLRLSGRGIDAAVLKQVGAMGSVTSVHLNEVNATPAGFAGLTALPDLETVSIQKSQLTADGVKSLLGIRKLRSLTLAANAIGPAGFAHLGALTRLEYLNLESTRCTDKDVACLLPLQNLTHLDLGYNPDLTDAMLPNLAALPKLTGVRLYRTQVTDAGIANLKKARPALSVGK